MTFIDLSCAALAVQESKNTGRQWPVWGFTRIPLKSVQSNTIVTSWYSVTTIFVHNPQYVLSRFSTAVETPAVEHDRRLEETFHVDLRNNTSIVCPQLPCGHWERLACQRACDTLHEARGTYVVGVTRLRLVSRTVGRSNVQMEAHIDALMVFTADQKTQMNQK